VAYTCRVLQICDLPASTFDPSLDPSSSHSLLLYLSFFFFFFLSSFPCDSRSRWVALLVVCFALLSLSLSLSRIVCLRCVLTLRRRLVFSFMSGKYRDHNSSPTPISPSLPATRPEVPRQETLKQSNPPTDVQQQTAAARDSPQMRPQRARASSRPLSMVQTYQPPLMELTQDTIPELQPIFTYLNSHGNKLYQEGYFLKLNDQDTSRTPCVMHRLLCMLTPLF
jgi:hypothetical protein